MRRSEKGDEMKYLFQGTYLISNDKSLLSIERIKQLLSKTYWANERPLHIIEKTVLNSDCYGLYYEKEQVGFARVISDYATTYYLCDVYIDEGHRGKGLGKELIQYIVNNDKYRGLKGMLVTKDAHGLYRQFGFESVEGVFMRKTK